MLVYHFPIRGCHLKHLWSHILNGCLLCCALWSAAVAGGPADSIVQVNHLNRQAAIYRYRQLDIGIKYVTRAQDIATRTGYEKGKAQAWQLLGDYYRLRNNDYLSVRYYTDALQSYRKLHDSSGIGQLYASLGTYYQEAGHGKLARQYIDTALQIGKQLHSDSQYVLILCQFATIMQNSGFAFDNLLQPLADARNTFARYRDTGNILLLDLLLIKDQLIKQDTAFAIQQLLTLTDKAAASGYYYPAIMGNRLLAAISTVRQQSDSLRYLAQMVRLSMRGGYRELMLPYALQLYDWYTARGIHDSAFIYSSLLRDILKQRNDVKSNGEMDYVSYYTQQHNLLTLELQRATRQKTLQIKQEESRNQLMMIGLMSVLLILTGLTGFYFYHSYRQNRRNAAVLQLKNNEINEKNAILSKQDDFKNKLVSVVAHDFRAPLSNIISITEFLKEEALTPAEATVWMQQVERSTTGTLQTFDNILAWINSQLSGFVYTPVACPLAKMFREALQYQEDITHKKQLQITIDIPEKQAVWADREMLQFVHRNFIHNAIKFSPDGGRVQITSSGSNGRVTISVADEGPGIPEEMLPRLFEYNNQRIRKGKQQGAGLALIICGDFMEKMNGRLNAANRSNGGAILSYTLPGVRSS